MKTSNRLIALLLAFVMVMSLAACGKAESSESAAEAPKATIPTNPVVEGTNSTETDETLVVLMEAATTSITCLSNATGGMIGNTGFGYLLSYDAENCCAVPDNATYEEIDATHYRFTIRDEAKFFDGTPVTAEDVLYSFQCYQDCGYTYIKYIDVANCVIEDEKNIIIALYDYMVGWELDIADTLPIFSKASIEEIGLDKTGLICPMSCGKYQITEFTAGETVLAERNPNYWDEDWTGYYKYIRFDPVTDSASRTLAVKSGDAQVAHRVEVTDYMSATPGSGATGFTVDAGVCYNIYFNCSEGVLNTPKLREAVAHAINPEDIAMVLTMGNGEVCQGIFGPNFPYYKEYYEGGHPSYDPELAKQLLAEEGATDLTIDLKVSALMQNAATVVQEQLRQVGVTVNVLTTESSVLTADLRNGNWDMSIWNTSQTALSNQNFNALDPAKIGAAPYNVRYNDPQVAELVQTAMTNVDEAVRRDAFDQVCQISYDNYTFVGICTANKYCVIADGLNGIRNCTRMGYLDFSDCYMAN